MMNENVKKFEPTGLVKVNDFLNIGVGDDVYCTEYLSEVQDPKLDKLIKLAEEYYYKTEEYDRTVCTGPIINGSIMANDNEEMSKICRFARNLDGELREQAKALGYTYLEWCEAKKLVKRKMRNE